MATSSNGASSIWTTGEIQGSDLSTIANWYNSNFYGFNVAGISSGSGLATASQINNLINTVHNGNGTWWTQPSVPGTVSTGQLARSLTFYAPSTTFSPYNITMPGGFASYATIPPGCNSVQVYLLIGGGGGGSNGTYYANGGGGGSSSWVAYRTVGVTHGNSLSGTIGPGGAGGTVNGAGYLTEGLLGGNSYVYLAGNTIATANAGSGGIDAAGAAPGYGGAGGPSDGGNGAEAGLSGYQGIVYQTSISVVGGYGGSSELQNFPEFGISGLGGAGGNYAVGQGQPEIRKNRHRLSPLRGG